MRRIQDVIGLSFTVRWQVIARGVASSRSESLRSWNVPTLQAIIEMQTKNTRFKVFLFIR